MSEALAHSLDKDAEAASRSELRCLFTKSLVARRALPAGHVLAADDVVAKKPGTGIAPERLPSLIGLALPRAIAADELLPLDLVEELVR